MQKQYLFGRRPPLGRQACHEAGMHYGSELQLPFFAVGKRMHLKKIWAVIYAVMLAAFSTFVLLDAFVIPKERIKADEPIQSQEITDESIYVAHIQLADASYLRAGLADGTFGRNVTEVTSQIAQDSNAILAINGDFYGFRNKGYVMRNGYLYRETAQQGRQGNSRQEDLVIYEDGHMDVIEENEVAAQTLKDSGASQIFSFGPGLIKNGNITVDENSEVEQSMQSNPRTAIGMITPLHYIMAVSDGRTEASEGLTLYQLAQIMKGQDCVTAYNLDGGGSSTMWFNGEVVNKPTSYGSKISERAVSDIVYIGR